MAAESERLDYWRKYFRSANSSIFEVIEQAILVAAADSPAELQRRRDRIAVVLFSSHLPVCDGCEKPRRPPPEEEDDGRGPAGDRRKAGSCSGGEGEAHAAASNYSYDEAEALTEEIEEESQTMGEVLRIKSILSHKDDESESVLFESLRRLQLMSISVEILKMTEIGKAVNGLRKHSSKQIRSLVRTLIEGWKVLVDEWVSTAALTESTPESMNPSMVDYEEGLPSPPLDEGILFTAHPTLELSQFFDGMDDDGNLQAGEDARMKPAGREIKAVPPVRVAGLFEDASQTLDDDFGRGRPKKLQSKQTISGSAAGPGRPQKLSLDGKATAGVAAVQRRQEPALGTMPKKLSQADCRDKSKSAEEMSVRVKLEAAKRKLHEGYQQAENAKKQRTIQVMELQDIPRQGLGHRQPSVKPGNLSKLRAVHGRR